MVVAALKQEEAQMHQDYAGKLGSEGAKPGCAGVFKQPGSYCSFGHLTCTIARVPKPGDGFKSDQEECLKVLPVMTALEDATLTSPALCSLCW